jgi:hypothetical protein
MAYLDRFEVVEVLADHGARVTRRVRQDGQSYVLKSISLQRSSNARDLVMCGCRGSSTANAKTTVATSNSTS